MRKSLIKEYIDLICDKCGCSFKKELKEYNRRTKNGKSKFFCGLMCFNQHTDDSKYKKKKFSPFCNMVNRAKCCSKKKMLDCNLTHEYLYSLWEKQKGICPYTGLKMVLQGNQLKNTDLPNTASVDRIDSSKGYVEENVELVCISVNLSKGSFSKDTMLEFYNQIKNV